LTPAAGNVLLAATDWHAGWEGYGNSFWRPRFAQAERGKLAGIEFRVPETPLRLEVATTAAIIWIPHIGFARALGNGLKYPDAFRHTHLTPMGGICSRRRPNSGPPI
jgi:hypothetical protein